jgi:hypothetical protein
MNLVQRIREVEQKHAARSHIRAWHDRKHAVLKTGWDAVDQSLGGLVCGLHEWFGADDQRHQQERTMRRGRWHPPICVLVHMAWQAVRASPRRWIVWVGEQCFPYGAVCVGKDRTLLECSLFVTVRNADLRVWAMDVALRCPAVGAVIADGSAFSMAATRRVQLLAKSHQTWALLARPPWERHELSAAQSRWLVRPTLSGGRAFINPRWTLELVRCKGVQLETILTEWTMEWNGATSTLDLSTTLADSVGNPKAGEAGNQQRSANAISA